MFDKLFSPISIGNITLKNRIVLPAMGTKMASETGEVTQQIIDYQVARVKGGCGLNISEVCGVHGPSSPRKFLGIYEDRHIASHKAFCDAIHKAGGACAVQLWQGSLAATMDPNAKVLVASDLPMGNFTIPGIGIEELHEVIEAFGQGARRAVEAGYDAIEFHAAHNYLPHSFLTPALNHRTDEYGGSFENRARFPLECIREIRKYMPEGMPLLMRIDAMDDYFQGGLTIEDMIAFCNLAKEEGVDVLDVSRGNMITAGVKYEVPPIDIPRGFNVENAARIRKETGMLTIAVGRINTPQQAEDILENDKADMVVMGRAQLADANFCNKAKAGQLEDITYCIGCDQGCYDGFTDPTMPFITCMRNPYVGKEAEAELRITTTPKKVLIAGGGLAGLEAACILKQRGHEPIVYEESDRLGGQFITAGKAPRKEEMLEAARSYGEKAKRLGVELHLETKLTPELIALSDADEVIIAIGSQPIVLPIKGAERALQSHDVLEGRIVPQGNCVVIGGGLVGAEVAEYLSEKGHHVCIVEQLDEIAKDLGALRKICVLESLYMHQIEQRTNTTCKAIEEHGILVEYQGKEEHLEADSVIMAVGSKSRATQALEEACKKANLPCHIIGDAKQARRALHAIHEANEIARGIE